MMIKNKFFFAISMLVLIILLWLIVDRIYFLASALKTTGTVYDISSTNSTCRTGGNRSRGKRYRSYNCTKFDAHIKYFPVNETFEVRFSISAGSSKGHNSNASNASFSKNQIVPVVYDPKNPEKIYEDSFFGVWGTPFMVFIFNIFSFFIAFTSDSRRKNEFR
jgi:hypothetical protein